MSPQPADAASGREIMHRVQGRLGYEGQHETDEDGGSGRRERRRHDDHVRDDEAKPTKGGRAGLEGERVREMARPTFPKLMHGPL